MLTLKVLFLFLKHSLSTYLLKHGFIVLSVQALMGIRESLEDPLGVLKNWDTNSVDPCSWTMVTCSPDNLVIGLYELLFSDSNH